MNREIIKAVLDEVSMIYNMETANINGVDRDTYLIKFFVDNNLVYGGITDGGDLDDSQITFLFFFDTENQEKNDDVELLDTVNKLNMSCKYGNFYLDEDKDIVFSLTVPVLGEKIEKDVVKFYFNTVVSIVSDAAKDVHYGR